MCTSDSYCLLGLSVLWWEEVVGRQVNVACY